MALIMLVTCLLSVDVDGDKYESNGIEIRQVYCILPEAMAREGSEPEHIANDQLHCSMRYTNISVTTFYNCDAPFHPIALYQHFAPSSALMPVLPIVSVLPAYKEVFSHAETRGPPRAPLPFIPTGLRAPPLA